MAFTIHDISIFADGLDHSECVAVHPDGSVWAGGEAGQIYKISPDGNHVEVIASTNGFILGIAFSPGASWLAVCDLKQKCIWKLDLASRALSVFANGAGGISFNIPNYISFSRNGKLFISESGGFRQVMGKIFCFDERGNGSVWHEGPFSFANGLALDADEKFLYVVCTWLPGVERIVINKDGTAGEREVFCLLPQTCPDGIAFDSVGNLYITCYAPSRIYKVNANKEVDILVDDWEAHTISNPTNIAFGGANFTELFVANLGRWHISKLDVRIEGLRLASHQ